MTTTVRGHRLAGVLALRLAFLLCALYAFFGAAAAAELRVLCPNALREPLLEIARPYARATGHRVEFVFASVGAIHKRIAMGERADVVIGTADGVAALEKLGATDGTDRKVIARSAIAFAVRVGSPKLDIATPEAIERTLRSAASLGLPDAARGAAGAAQTVELIEQLHLMQDLQARIRPFGSAGDAAKLLGSGGIDLALLPMSGAVGMTGVSIAGPIVALRTQGIAYAAAVPRLAQQAELGRAFIEHLSSPAAVKMLQQSGYLVSD